MKIKTYPLLIVVWMRVVSAVTQTFEYTGAYQEFVVPSTVSSIDMTLSGAQGGGNYVGVTVSANISVRGGETLYVFVGGAGSCTRTEGGFNGGGAGSKLFGVSIGCSGGGASDVRRDVNDLSTRLITAGGSGGGFVFSLWGSSVHQDGRVVFTYADLQSGEEDRNRMLENADYVITKHDDDSKHGGDDDKHNRDDDKHDRDDDKHNRDDDKHNRDDDKHNRDDDKHNNDDHAERPSERPTVKPYFAPSGVPNKPPTQRPIAPTVSPSEDRTRTPTLAPTRESPLTLVPSVAPIIRSASPSVTPYVPPLSTAAPNFAPTAQPSMLPTTDPSVTPSMGPTLTPSLGPTLAPTNSPTVVPTVKPSRGPTLYPSVKPSRGPTVTPSALPSVAPSVTPTLAAGTTAAPSISMTPSLSPTIQPSHAPSVSPSAEPTESPTVTPSAEPSEAPSQPSQSPTIAPTVTGPYPPSLLAPTAAPSVTPTLAAGTTASPTLFVAPTVTPSVALTGFPWVTPTVCPSVRPSLLPTFVPTTAHIDAFTVTQNLFGISETLFYSDPNNAQVFTSSAAASMPPLTPNDITIDSVTDVTTGIRRSRHLLRSRYLLTDSAVSVVYSVEYYLAATGYNTSDAAYSSISQSLNDSVTSGDFDALLNSYSTYFDAPDMFGVTSDRVITTEPTQVFSDDANNKGGIGDASTKQKNAALIVGLVLGLSVAVCCVICWTGSCSSYDQEETGEPPAVKKLSSISLDSSSDLLDDIEEDSSGAFKRELRSRKDTDSCASSRSRTSLKFEKMDMVVDGNPVKAVKRSRSKDSDRSLKRTRTYSY